jgi:DNA-binding NtrC family response regulator
MLEDYPWPGNVRELRNVVERSILFAQDGIADIDVLPREIIEAAAREQEAALTIGAVDHAAPATENGEVNAINRAIRMAGGNLSIAAVMLGVSRSTLYRKMSQYGLKRISPIEINTRTDDGKSSMQ